MLRAKGIHLSILVLHLSIAACRNSSTLWDIYQEESTTDEDKVIGGTPVPAGSYTFQVALLYSSKFFCGGSLIATNQVLTAAHCLQSPVTASSVKLYLNTIQNPEMSVDPNAIVRGAASFRIHPSYNPQTFDYDVAVITLDSPVTNIGVVGLPGSDDGNTYVGQTGTVIGWGRTDDADKNSISDRMKYADLPVIDNAQCSQMIPGVTAAKFCTSSAAGQSFCNGDSGGPLILNGIQVGIVSYMLAATCTKVNVYTRVASHLAWIRTQSPTPTPIPGKAFIRRLLLALLALFS